tara:strand:+ start:289 stop:585 length:297 start_codon:yes stop_codon:yes gene_type:complete
MKLTWKEMDALITNGILAYEPYGSFYCVDNDGELYMQPMGVGETKPIDDWDEWCYIDFCLLVDEEDDSENLFVEANVLRDIRDYLSLRAVMGGEEVQA